MLTCSLLPLVIVMELVEGGDLLDRIIHSGGHGIPEEQARAWTAEMVDAIQVRCPSRPTDSSHRANASARLFAVHSPKENHAS